MKTRIINVNIAIASHRAQHYISLTDMVWEQLNNPVFSSLEFEGIERCIPAVTSDAFRRPCI